MQNILTTIPIAVIMACIIHEAGHYIVALAFGSRIKFRFAWGYLWKIPVPRYIWYMPETFTKQQKQITAIAGFMLESVTAALVLVSRNYVVFPVVVFLHLVLYKFYAGEASDFKYILGKE